MTKKQLKNAVEVEKVLGRLAVATDKALGNVNGLITNISKSGLVITAPSKSGLRFYDITVSISLNGDIFENFISNYYINFPTMWSSAEHASTLSFLLGKASDIAKELEEIGITYKN